MTIESDPGEISPGYFYARKTANRVFFMPGEVMPGFFVPGESVLCRAFLRPEQGEKKNAY
jgi:hypothetical protein